MRIPIEMLAPETLRNVVENFITREGTDYGVHEVHLETKIEQVLRQLKSGKAYLVYDDATESCNIIVSDQYSKQQPAADELPRNFVPAEIEEPPTIDWFEPIDYLE